jgi:hypothetical protein
LSKFKNKKRFAIKKLAPTCAVEQILNFFFNNEEKNIFFLNGIKNKKSKKLPHFEVIFYDTCSLKIENRSYRFFKKR